MPTLDSDRAADGRFDATKRYYRLRQVRDDGHVEFEFAIGEPDLSVELILPRAAFDDFLRQTRAQPISDAAAAEADARLRAYLYGDDQPLT